LLNRLKKLAVRRSTEGLHPTMPISRFLSRSYLEIGFAYLASYVLLDWVSYIQPIASLGITPWNPPPGLSFALILLFGRAFLPWLFLAPLLADGVVRQLPLPLWGELATALIIGAGYGAGATFLTRPALRFDISFSNKRDLFWLVAVAAVSAAFVALAYVSLVAALGFLDAQQFAAAALRYWIGDMIGMTVVTPFILILFTRRRIRVVTWELLGPLALIFAALWLTMRYVDLVHFPLFYLLFIPVLWSAIRFGLEGVVFGLAVTQIGLIAAIHLSPSEAIDVTAFQALMIVLAVTGLAVGLLVNEQQRTEQQLRSQQDAIARVIRVGSMGEFAAALAHEINQPLMAIANYTKLAKELAEQTPTDNATVAEASGKAAEQVERAAEVVRRLREFIRLGRSEPVAVPVGQVIAQARQYCEADLERHGIVLDVDTPASLPTVLVDPLQIQQVIINLIRNAVDAIAEAGRYDGRIIVTAERDGGLVSICVRDNGPGFEAGLIDRAIAPFVSTKPDGMGLGLSLCRSIVEAHGGKLSIGGDPTGAKVVFTLRVAEVVSDAV
jgi:two-component system, LuxR family, sensor kinase FixL